MKNNKKGFTLVELLAVIAILAILVIIALPNVLNMFEQARKNSFLNEVKEIYRIAQSQYVLDATGAVSSSQVVYSNKTGSAHTLQLDGGGNIGYCIVVGGTGTVSEMSVSNGIYSYTWGDATDNSENGNLTSVVGIDVDSTLVPVADAKVFCD